MTVTILSVAGNIVIHLVTPTINIITIEGIAEINIMIIALLSTQHDNIDSNGLLSLEQR